MVKLNSEAVVAHFAAITLAVDKHLEIIYFTSRLLGDSCSASCARPRLSPSPAGKALEFLAGSAEPACSDEEPTWA